MLKKFIAKLRDTISPSRAAKSASAGSGKATAPHPKQHSTESRPEHEPRRDSGRSHDPKSRGHSSERGAGKPHSASGGAHGHSSPGAHESRPRRDDRRDSSGPRAGGRGE